MAIGWTSRDAVLFAGPPAVIERRGSWYHRGPHRGTQTAPRDLFTNYLLNGIAAFALAGVIQVWFATGETKRANWERTQAAQERECADSECEQAAREREQADRERERAARPENTLATTLLRLEELASEVADLRRRLDERANGNPSD